MKVTTLQHKGPIREYVKEYYTCMLDFKDMIEIDWLFNFVKGLKEWAQREIWRLKVDTLSGVIAAAERLKDYSFERAAAQKKGNVTQRRALPANGSQTSSKSVGNKYRSREEDSRRAVLVLFLFQ